MPPPVTLYVLAVELALLLSGLVLFWRHGLSPAARAKPALLPKWDVSVSDFFLFVWLVMMGGFLGSSLAGLYFKYFPASTPKLLAVGTVMMHAGLLLGMAVYWLAFSRKQSRIGFSLPGAFKSGLVTFLIAQPVVSTAALAWQLVLKLCHYPITPQDSVELLRHTDSLAVKITLVAAAVMIAPISEELIFRAGVFRYVRTRLPRWIALFLPALLFAGTHQDVSSLVPLMALGVVFSLAYERTGNIGTTMVAHFLFNLNTATILLLGVDF